MNEMHLTKTEQLVEKLFIRIRNLYMKHYNVPKRDATSEIQIFMRQCCKVYNSKTHEWDDMKPTKVLEMLRTKLREDKKQFNMNNK